jgi:hypothetical protein
MDAIDEINELDEAWINDFEENDKHFEIFYSEDIEYVKMHFIYLDKENNIEKVKEDKFFFKTPNIISRDEIMGVLKTYSFIDATKYSIQSILKYNIDLEPLDVKHFLKNASSNKYSYLTSITNIDDITFKKTIAMFHDLNNLCFLFYQKDKPQGTNSEKMTKKARFIENNKKHTRHNK